MRKLFNKIWYPDEETRAMAYVPISVMLLPTLILGFFLPFFVVILLMFSFVAIGGIVRVRAAMIAELDDDEKERVSNSRSFRKPARIFVVVSGLLSLVLYFVLPSSISSVAIFTALTVSVIMIGFAGYSMRTTIVIASILIAIIFALGTMENYRLGLIFAGMTLVAGLPYCIENVVRTQRILAGDTKQKVSPVDLGS